MKSNSIFTVTHRQGDERVYRAQDGTKGTQKCLCDVGYISGNAWNMLAITLPGFTDNEAWYVINLVDQQNVFLASVAVLGATSGEHAVNMVLRTFNGDFCGVATASQYDIPEAQAFVLKRLLDNEARAMFKARVNYEELAKIRNRLTLVPAVWNESAEIVSHKNVGELVSDIARNDYNSELVTRVSPASIQSEVMQGSETDQYDSIVIQVSRLDAWSKRIMLAMGEAADKVKPVNVTTTDPFKKNGVVNVAQIYELSDGQTVTIVYHNPDSTPARLDPKDILTSWKFLLNKRDVTAALQPKSGKDVNVKDLAKRVLKIAEANSARFIRNQERKAGAQQALDELAKIEQEKRDLLASLIQEIADLQRQLDEPIGSFAADESKGTISGSNDDPQIAANDLVTNANGDIVNKQGDAFSARSITQRIITNFKLVGYVPKRTAEGYVLHRFDEPYFKENGSIIIGNPKSSNAVIKCEPKLIFERFGRTFVVVQNNEAGQNQFETVDLITRLSIPSQDGETLFSSIMDAYKQTSSALEGFTEEQFNNSTLAKTPQADYTEAVLMAEGKLAQPSEEQVQVESSNPLTESQEDTEVQEQMANEQIPEPIQAEATMNNNQNENPDEKWLDQIIGGEIELAPLNMDDFSQVAVKYATEINTPMYSKLEQALTAITSAKMDKAKAVQGA